ncbi:MAG: hypothetical protein AAB403_00110, partial [Planctomycetota bacterium]
ASLCLLLTAQYSGSEYPVQVAGRPLILQGSYPAGAPGGAWSKVRIADPWIGDFNWTSGRERTRDSEHGIDIGRCRLVGACLAEPRARVGRKAGDFS